MDDKFDINDGVDPIMLDPFGSDYSFSLNDSSVSELTKTPPPSPAQSVDDFVLDNLAKTELYNLKPRIFTRRKKS